MIENFVFLQLKEEEVKVSQHDVALLPFSNYDRAALNQMIPGF
jgi:hypothetical protein